MMLKKIEEQTKTIDYIKKMYKQKTGEEVVMPMSWQDYLCLEQADIPSHPLPSLDQQQQSTLDFRTAIDHLSLPTRINASKIPLTSFSPTNKFHMVENIDLSGFKDLGFSKALLREFLSRIVEMRALHSVCLKLNGIDDNCAEQIEALLQIKRISRVDLSSNMMGKSCLQIISKNFGHLEWVDLSRNYFLFEVYSLQNLLNAIRLNGKIWHICLDLQDTKQLHTLCGYMKIKPQLHSLGLIDSNIEAESMNLICRVLQQASAPSKKQKQVRINHLNFSFCYLSKPVLTSLFKAVSLNNTLISLNLSNNNMGQFLGMAFCKTLQASISLVRVVLSGNLLQDNFGKALAECLQKNEIVQFVDISKNNIGQQGAKLIYEVLSTKNDTLESLGDFQTNARMGQQLLQKIRKALKINKVSKQIRSKIMAEQTDLSPVQISNRQTQAYLEAEYQDFDLLTPIAVSNPLRDDPNQIHIWKFQ